MAVSIQQRGKGSINKSDWNELDDFPEEVFTYLYFISMEASDASDTTGKENGEGGDDESGKDTNNKE